MSTSTDCSQNRDQLQLVREGTSREQRLYPALDPAYAPVDEHSIEHRMVFAQAYAACLKYHDPTNTEAGDWKPFFSEDVSVRLAVAAVQDVTYYRQKVKEFAAFLNDRKNRKYTDLRNHLDYLFSCCATLAIRLDLLKESLPPEIALGQSLRNLVQGRLAPALMRLISYRKGGEAIAGTKPVNLGVQEKAAVDTLDGKEVPLAILGGDAVKFSVLGSADLSKDWTKGEDWQTYYDGINGDDSVYGDGNTVFNRVNHIATHNLFTSVLDQFLKAYAHAVSNAKQELEKNLAERDRHEPHYALFLALLRLFEHARAEANTITGRHLDFYYREILRLKEKDAAPGHAHLLVELAKQVDSHEFKAGILFKAGKDGLGRDVYFASNRDFVANKAKVAALKTIYRHGIEKVGTTAPTDIHEGRLYASPVANSDDGLGAELTSEDQSWHPFFNKTYEGRSLSKIRMPEAEVGFAIASHYLLMAEGKRTVTVNFTTTSSVGAQLHYAAEFMQYVDKFVPPKNFKKKYRFPWETAHEISDSINYNEDIVCLFTGEKGWVEKTASIFDIKDDALKLEIELSGADPAIVPYSAKKHGYGFSTDLPILLVKLRHQEKVEYIYPLLQDVEITKIDLEVDAKNLKTLAVSNDFGPVDTSKPFQPFGASPVKDNALIIGSNEVFQKKLSEATVKVKWQSPPEPFGDKKDKVEVITEYLQGGMWQNYKLGPDVQKKITEKSEELFSFSLLGEPESDKLPPYLDAPDLSKLENYNNSSRHGFVRLKISDDFGQGKYQDELLNYIVKATDDIANNEVEKPTPPTGPSITELTLNYTANQTITLDSDKSKFEKRQSRFFHIAPFGHAEQHPVLNSSKKVHLLPQFEFQRDKAKQESEAEFYIGVTALKPPQNLALLFQVADGTANPLTEKPDKHIHWGYLHDNEWMPFAENEVEDRTGGLLNSGIVTFAVPRDASNTNTILPAGMHWIRGAVASGSEAVCRLVMVAAQALEVTYADKDNDPAFPARVLDTGTIGKLDQPDAAVKKITQPFPTFGGRGKEAPTAFHTRVSERLRHKERAIALWDYERLVLEAFPQIYKVKCLNHTQYEATENGSGIYRELAPGHVTVVTIPNQQFHNLRDPLQPYTSLGLLEEIESFLSKRLSCFVKLHVRNPEFEEVKVTFKVRLHDGFDETFNVKKLNTDITRFLSPWAFPGGAPPTFGGKIRKSALINFIEDQPCVDYVTDFQLFHSFLDNHNNPQTVEKDEVAGSKAVSILVSAMEHEITTFNPAEIDAPGEKCPCTA